MSAEDIDHDKALAELAALEDLPGWKRILAEFQREQAMAGETLLDPRATSDEDCLIGRKVRQKLNELSPAAMLERLQSNHRAGAKATHPVLNE